MRSPAIMLACVALAGCATPAPPLNPAQRYGQVAARNACPTFADLDLDRLEPMAWTPPRALLEFHKQLRAEHGLAAPSAETRVLIGWRGGHHEVVGGSIIAVRQASGEWTITGVATSRSLVPPPPGGIAPKEEVDIREWRTSPEDAKRLDTLVRGECLRAEPRQIYLAAGPYRLDGSRAHCVGSSTVTTEVEVEGRRLVSAQHCGEWGAAGEIRKLVMRGAGR